MSEYLGRKVLIYQRFRENYHPDSPFEAVICKDLRSRWLVKYRLLDGNLVEKSVLKGVCSSKPIDNSVDKSVIFDQNVLQSSKKGRIKLRPRGSKTEEKKAQIRRKLPIKPRI